MEKSKNKKMWMCFYIEDKGGVSIIDSIPHCHSDAVLYNALKCSKYEDSK